MKKEIISLVFVLLMIPSTALATGDPIYLYSALLVVLIQIILLFLLLFSKRLNELRKPSIGIYGTILAYSWIWGISYQGHLNKLFLGLLVGPILTFCCLLWISKQLK